MHESDPQAPPTNASPRRPLVLLVDDVPDNLRVVGNLLKEDNLEIAIAMTGRETLEFTRNDVPDLILLDVMLPDMDGFEVCRHLKANLLTMGVPVIFLTARTETDDIVRGFEAGGVDYITKPFRPAELRARVRTHLELRQLKGLLSICSYCNRIREAPDHWERIDTYLHKRTGALFSHGMCPECVKKFEAGLQLGSIS